MIEIGPFGTLSRLSRKDKLRNHFNMHEGRMKEAPSLYHIGIAFDIPLAQNATNNRVLA